jgi:Matrixin
MNTKFSSTILTIFLIIFTSVIIFAQKAEPNRSKSLANKKSYKQFQLHNSTISKPSNLTRQKSKDFTINRKESVNKSNQRNKKYYSTKRENSKIINSENYFHIDKSGNSLWDGKHWNLDEFPVIVYVKESSSKYYKSGYKDYVDYAFRVWQKADNRIKYTFTNNSRDADIQFVFVENLGKKYEENYLGLTDYEVNRENEIEQSKIQISLLKLGSEAVSAGEIKATIVHELGHAFGLGHSESETDIMYPYISTDHSYKMTYDELSRGDKEAIKHAIDLGDEEKYVLQ